MKIADHIKHLLYKPGDLCLIDPWNPHKVRRKEPSPRSCSLTSICMLWQTLTTTTTHCMCIKRIYIHAYTQLIRKIRTINFLPPRITSFHKMQTLAYGESLKKNVFKSNRSKKQVCLTKQISNKNQSKETFHSDSKEGHFILIKG